MDDKTEILKVENICKSFPGVQVLTNVNMSFKRGRVHAIMGENGAGKSTLMNIIFGYHQADSGKMYFEGKEVSFTSPVESQASGIAMIHQENSLMPYLSVANNIYLGHYPKSGLFIDDTKMKNDAQTLLDSLDIYDISPSDRVGKLSVAQKQLVEIAKALSRHPSILMMDEPTATLTDKEVMTLKKIISRLKNEGTAIIYVSHRIEEVFEVSDDITILRDGNVIKTTTVDDISMEDAVRFMVGRDFNESLKTVADKKPLPENAEVVMEVKNLCAAGLFKDVSFKLKRGEVLGFGGLVGAGRSEVAEAIIGYRPHDSGEIFINGKRAEIKHPLDAIKYHMGMLPEERKTNGIFGVLGVKENINIASYGQLKKGGFISRSKENEAASDYVKMLDIKTPSLHKRVDNLSGGNQQKTILSRWLETKPEILILDEPTHGIDVGTKAEIYRIIRELAEQGMSIILISSELPELMTMSDEIVVMCKGEIRAMLQKEEFSEEEIMMYATGIK